MKSTGKEIGDEINIIRRFNLLQHIFLLKRQSIYYFSVDNFYYSLIYKLL